MKTERSYQPSNGTEGEMFMERWCYRCKRDEQFQRTGDGEDGCPIILGTMAYSPGDPEYPKEWVTDGVFVEDAKCTAFEPIEGGE